MNNINTFPFFFGVLILLNSCIFGNKNFNAPKVNYTTKEIQFIDSLFKEGYRKVELNRPMIGLYAYGSSTQFLFLSLELDVQKHNKDSLLHINAELAKLMYNNILEDSIIFDSRDIKVEIIYTNKGKSRSFSRYYLKDSLEKWSGFNVVNIGKNQYKRVSI